MTDTGGLLNDRAWRLAETIRSRIDDLGGVSHTLGNGGTVLDPEVVSQILVRSHRRNALDALTPREHDVLQLMAEGRTNSAIAAALHISVGSAEKHIASIFTKLDLAQDESENRRVLAVLRFLES